MSEKLNESLLDLIEKEGEAERFWDILARFEDDPKSSIDDMFPLADHGSTLTLYFIGDILLWGYKGIHNVKEGLICLQRAADQGSLEAIYQIGRAYYAWGKIPEAIEHFDYLSKKGFSPAMYSLAALYSYQKYGDNYKELSFIYYNMAAKHGNILARKNLSLKMIRGDFGLKKIFNGILMWITVIWPYIDIELHYPQSDRLRGAETSRMTSGLSRVTRPALLLLDYVNQRKRQKRPAFR